MNTVPDIDLLCDPERRMRKLISSAGCPDVNQDVPISRYYRSMNEVFRVASFCMEDKEFEKALIYYIRFITLAVEKLPVHKEFSGHVSQEKKKAEKVIELAVGNAEKIKQLLSKTFEEDATKARLRRDQEAAALQQRAKSKAKQPSAPEIASDSSVSDGTGTASSSSSSRSDHLGTVLISSDLVERFAKLSEANSAKDVETCAILCGSPMSAHKFIITHLVVPKQRGEANSCETYGEEELFAYQDEHHLITLGWIHSHPSQTAFLSSIDLHTHLCYQQMLPESIAIVVAPKHNQTGIFRLTEKGMQDVGNCRERGFHPHNTSGEGSGAGENLFYYCHDTAFVEHPRVTVCDLR